MTFRLEILSPPPLLGLKNVIANPARKPTPPPSLRDEAAGVIMINDVFFTSE
jgi:hypothetical protein